MLQNLQKKSHERSHALMCSSTYQYPRHMQPSARLHTLLSDFSKAFLQKTIQWNQNTLIVLIPSSFFHTHVHMCRLTAAHTQSEKMFQHNTRSWHWWSGLTAWQWAKLVMVHNVRHPPPTHTHSLAAGMPVILPKGPNDESLDWGVKWTKLAKNALFEDLDCDNYCHYQGGDLKKDAIAIVQL